jgi:probable rRNA maturation factor
VSIEIRNESGVAVDEAGLAALARHVLDGMRVHPLAELSVLLVDEAAMTGLHQRWMGEDGPTDVLAFPMDELGLPPPGGSQAEHGTDDEAAETLLGDVVLCPQVAVEQAGKAGHGVQDELELLCTHGILHLLGYDHAEPDEHATMFGLQDRLLAGWRSERDGDGGRQAGPEGLGGPENDRAEAESGPEGPEGQEDPERPGAGGEPERDPGPEGPEGPGGPGGSVGPGAGKAG